MVVSEILGGFGNQLFQYAHGYALAKELNCPLFLDARQFKQYQLRKFDLNNFETYSKTLHERNSLKIKRTNSVVYLSPYFGARKLDLAQEKSLAYNSITPTSGNILLKGYWQCEKYFSKHGNDIRRIFSEPQNLNSSEYQMWKSKIKATQNSVAVHLRRGDYVSNEETRKVHYVCNEAYYKNALNFFNKRFPRPTYYFFSDDIEWVKANINNIPNSHYVSSPALSSISEFFLMKTCEHSIISNSTFSWWATWLRDKEGVVATPNKWFNVDEMNCIEIIPERWNKIKI